MQIAAGDIVTIEVMEGQRRKIDLPVSALVDEVIGMSAYMEVDTLNRLTGEGAVVRPRPCSSSLRRSRRCRSDSSSCP